jgi:hypothetical protein
MTRQMPQSTAGSLKAIAVQQVTAPLSYDATRRRRLNTNPNLRAAAIVRV